MDDWGGGGGDRGRKGGGRGADGGGRGGGGGGRGGGGGGGGRGGGGGGGGGRGGFNKHRQSLGFQQHVPKFIANMLAANPAVKLQGQIAHVRSGEDGEQRLSGFDAMAQEMMIDAATNRPTSKAAQMPEGRERPEMEDEAPQVANLDDYADQDLTGILPTIAKAKSRQEEAKDDSATSSSSAGASSIAASSTAATPAASSTPALSLTEARMMSVKRAREDDAAADAIEQQTGKHIFRKAIKDPEADANKGLSQEEIARKKRQKLKEAKKATSMLTFNEEDI